MEECASSAKAVAAFNHVVSALAYYRKWICSTTIPFHDLHGVFLLRLIINPKNLSRLFENGALHISKNLLGLSKSLGANASADGKLQ